MTGLAAAAKARAAAGVDVWGRTAAEVAATRSLGAGNSNSPAAIPVAAPAAARAAEAAAVTGVAGAGVGAVSAFRSALISLVSPATAIQFLLFSIGGAAVQYFTTAESASKKFEDSLQAHVKAVQDLGKAYRDAAIDMGEVQRKSVIAAEALERLRRAELNRELKTQTDALTSGLSSFNLGTYLPDWLRSSNVTPVFAPFTEATEELRDGLKRGKPDFDAFEKQIKSISDTDPGKLRQWGDILIDMAAKVAQARRELGMLDEFNRNGRGDRVVGPAAMDDRAAAARRLMEEPRAAREQQQRIQQDQMDAELQMMRARTNAQRLAAIEAKVRAEPAGQNDPGVDVRVQRALTIERSRQAVEERNANDDRHRAQLRSIEAAREELSLIGATSGETAKLNYQYSEIARLKDQAYKRGGIVSPEEVALIKETADELGNIVDLQTRLNLNRDLAFERSQQFLSPEEQAIASRLRGTGIGTDSPEAQAMRDMNQFADAKELAQGFLTDFKSELLRNGGDVGEALGTAILNALTASMDKQLSDIFDRLATWIAAALTGRRPGAGLGGSAGFAANTTLSAFLGAGGAADNSNYMPGAVTRSGLPAVGGSVAQQSWNFFKGKGLADHQVAAILGHENAESAFRPTAVGDQGNAFGLFQWNDRGPAMLNSIGGKGNLGDVQGQLDFAWKELQTNESGTLAKLRASPDLRSATAAFGGFERPQGWSAANPEGMHNFSGRLSGAEAALAKFSGTATDAAKDITSLGDGATSAVKALAGSAGAGSGGLASILEGLKPANFQANTSLSAILGYGGAPAAPTAGGGGGGFLSMLLGFLPGLFGFADGTENAPEGWAWVGERGPELRKLRGGDTIRSHGHSMDMAANSNMSARGGGRGQEGRVEFNLNIDGANGDPHVRMLARQAAEEAISQYHQAQASGGFGELQQQYASQKG
ncbi:phage tail tip lysozyme [Mesorhizobium sp. M0701]|uniref:phage tail tip lysozyme n=1 Tax=Mesorhizobium sp. M0701 TaxID=2956989 RepID=UPI00333A2BD0